jgi:hypothetical protein
MEVQSPKPEVETITVEIDTDCLTCKKACIQARVTLVLRREDSLKFWTFNLNFRQLIKMVVDKEDMFANIVTLQMELN